MDLLEAASQLGPIGLLIVILAIIYFNRKNDNGNKDHNSFNCSFNSEIVGEIADIKEICNECRRLGYQNKNMITELHDLLTEKDENGTYYWWNKREIERKVDEIFQSLRRT